MTDRLGHRPLGKHLLAVDLLGQLDHPDCLVYGIGNVGRQDDGLGWAFVERLQDAGRYRRAHFLCSYQLALEDADTIGRMRRILFVDSTKDSAVESYAVTAPEPNLDVSFTSHALSVPALLATTRLCFDRLPQVWLLALRGYSWELQIGLTEAAATNLDAALAALGALAAPRPTPTSTIPS